MEYQHAEFFYGAIPDIFSKAADLRKRMTPAEKLLWSRLRKNQIEGLRFKAQHPIYTFIVDFYCHKAKLVIEIDGGYHFINDNMIYDKNRENIMKEFGLTTIRFQNNEVFDDIETVLNKIKDCLKERVSQNPKGDASNFR